MVGADNTFERWLEQQLQARAMTLKGQHPMPAQAAYHAAFLRQSNHVPLAAKVAGLLSAKAAIGLTLGVMAVSAAGAGEAAITGSANPAAWGRQVVEQVQTCKGALTSGSHGIGDCVSTFANQHGAQVSSDHRASGARTNEPSKGKSKDHAGGNGNGNGNGQAQGNSQGQGNGGKAGHGPGDGGAGQGHDHGGHGDGDGGGHGGGKH